MLSKDVVAVEGAFINLLQHIPGTKEEKQAHFAARGIRVPRTNHEAMWEVLTGRLHHSGAAAAVFELLQARMPPRLATLLRQAGRGAPVNLTISDPAIVHDLFFQNGNLRRIGELFLEHLGDRGVEPALGKAAHPPVFASGKPYEVAFSFAGEDRALVGDVARELRSRGVRVFYDEFEQVTLLGKDLAAHFAEIYKNRADYCAMFISEHYVRKAWPRLERQHAQARALAEGGEYILPIRLDDSEVPGLPSTIGYVDARNLSPRAIVDILFQKIRG
jgi:hypothetical protein